MSDRPTSLSISFSLSASSCTYGARTAFPPLISAATCALTLLAKAEENSPPERPKERKGVEEERGEKKTEGGRKMGREGE